MTTTYEQFKAGAALHTTTLDDRRAAMTIQVKRADGVEYIEYRVSKFERSCPIIRDESDIINAYNAAFISA